MNERYAEQVPKVNLTWRKNALSSTPVNTIREVIVTTTTRLSGSSPSARLDAELLVAHVLGVERSTLITAAYDPFPIAHERALEALVTRRRKHEPMAYILGRQEFWGLEFEVQPDVLIPRPETEHLVEQSLIVLEQFSHARILELGTGSGCISVALMHELRARGKTADLVAVDKSINALHVAHRNAVRHSLAEHIMFVASDWCEALEGTYDLIVTNPPYVADGATNVSPETRFEPVTALYAGRDGLDAIRCIVSGVTQHLAPLGTFLSEIGSEQGILLREEFSLPWLRQFSIKQIIRDLSNQDRILKLSR